MSIGVVDLVDFCATKTGLTVRQTQVKLKMVSRSIPTVAIPVSIVFSFQKKNETLKNEVDCVKAVLSYRQGAA
jgi:hypothetical protein